MSTGTGTTSIPTTPIGNVQLPKLVMGIHPFDGVSYQNSEQDSKNLEMFGTVAPVSDVLRYAVEKQGLSVVQIDHMNPRLNRMHLQAIWETELVLKTTINLLAYILIPISLDGELTSYSHKAHSTLYAKDFTVGGKDFAEKIYEDEILKYTLEGSFDNLVTPDTVAPFTPHEIERLYIDYAVLEQYLGFFAGCDIFIADPGAEIDLLAATGRFDLINEYISFLRKRFKTVITSVHHAGSTIPLLEKEGIDVDGYLTPINELGMYMFPTRDIAVDAIKQTNRPVIGMKPLAGGRYLGPKAFEYVFDTIGADSCMYGLGSCKQVQETTIAAKSVLGI